MKLRRVQGLTSLISPCRDRELQRHTHPVVSREARPSAVKTLWSLRAGCDLDHDAERVVRLSLAQAKLGSGYSYLSRLTRNCV